VGKREAGSGARHRNVQLLDRFEQRPQGCHAAQADLGVIARRLRDGDRTLVHCVKIP